MQCKDANSDQANNAINQSNIHTSPFPTQVNKNTSRLGGVFAWNLGMYTLNLRNRNSAHSSSKSEGNERKAQYYTAVEGHLSIYS